jgi:hypothetical protein
MFVDGFGFWLKGMQAKSIVAGMVISRTECTNPDPLCDSPLPFPIVSRR